jgi:hypothetical protein
MSYEIDVQGQSNGEVLRGESAMAFDVRAYQSANPKSVEDAVPLAGKETQHQFVLSFLQALGIE